VVVTRDRNYTLSPPPQSSPIKGEEEKGKNPLPQGERKNQKIPSPLMGEGAPTAVGAGEGVCVHHSVDEALEHHSAEEIMVAGGGEIFRQTMDKADTLYVTEVDKIVEGDVYFPTIDPKIWKEVTREPHDGFSFVTYIRNS